MLGAIAMVHIKVNDSDAVKAIGIQSVTSANDHVVEKAEPHGFVSFRMVPGGTHATKHIFGLALHDQVHPFNSCPRGAQRCIQRVFVHSRIAIYPQQFITRRGR